MIQGEEKPKPGHTRNRKAAELLICPKCNSTETVETRCTRLVKDGKVSAGQRRIRCYHCAYVLVG